MRNGINKVFALGWKETATHLNFTYRCNNNSDFENCLGQIYPSHLAWEQYTVHLLPTWIYSCHSGGKVRFALPFQWSGRGFCQMGYFQLFSMILKFSMGHFLSFYTDFYGPFSKLMGPWRMAPCLPNHCIYDKHYNFTNFPFRTW